MARFLVSGKYGAGLFPLGMTTHQNLKFMSKDNLALLARGSGGNVRTILPSLPVSESYH